MVLLLSSIALLSNQAKGAIVVGSGFSSVTGGRTSPMLYGGIDTSSFAFLANAVGVKTALYYHSAYQLSYYHQFEVGDFIWGAVRSGVGLSAFYAIRGYREDLTSEEANSEDFTMGPAIRVRWDIMPLLFVSIDAMYGIDTAQVFVLSTKQVTNLTFGVRF